MEYHVYVIHCPVSRLPKYVGVSNNVEVRMKQHIKSSYSGKMADFMDHLTSIGKKPVVKVISTYDNREVAELYEKETIEKYQSLGYDLINHRHIKKPKDILFLTDFED